MALLEIQNLSVAFQTSSGSFTAVDRFSLNVEPGDVVSIVGESGSGKSVAMLALMGLLPWTAQVTADALFFDGRDLLTIDANARRQVIGKLITMIFQEPMTSLNPCFTVGFQLTEALKAANPEVIQEMIMELVSGNQQTSVMLSDIMSYPVIKVHEDTPVEDVIQILRDMGCTGLPVVDSQDDLVGIVSRRDLKKVRQSKQMTAPIKAFMVRNVVTISHDRSAVEVARLMIKHDIGRVPVVKDGKMIGIVTRSDVMIYFYDMLPD